MVWETADSTTRLSTDGDCSLFRASGSPPPRWQIWACSFSGVKYDGAKRHFLGTLMDSDNPLAQIGSFQITSFALSKVVLLALSEKGLEHKHSSHELGEFLHKKGMARIWPPIIGWSRPRTEVSVLDDVAFHDLNLVTFLSRGQVSPSSMTLAALNPVVEPYQFRRQKRYLVAICS
jgi:hypothetical protein